MVAAGEALQRYMQRPKHLLQVHTALHQTITPVLCTTGQKPKSIQQIKGKCFRLFPTVKETERALYENGKFD